MQRSCSFRFFKSFRNKRGKQVQVSSPLFPGAHSLNRAAPGSAFPVRKQTAVECRQEAEIGLLLRSANTTKRPLYGCPHALEGRSSPPVAQKLRHLDGSAFIVLDQAQTDFRCVTPRQIQRGRSGAALPLGRAPGYRFVEKNTRTGGAYVSGLRTAGEAFGCESTRLRRQRWQITGPVRSTCLQTDRPVRGPCESPARAERGNVAGVSPV